jgi:hypothetical protein
MDRRHRGAETSPQRVSSQTIEIVKVDEYLRTSIRRPVTSPAAKMWGVDVAGQRRKEQVQRHLVARHSALAEHSQVTALVDAVNVRLPVGRCSGDGAPRCVSCSRRWLCVRDAAE